MTRTERLLEQVRKAKANAAELERRQKEQRAEQHVQRRKAEAALREATRKADNKRRYHWGAVAQEAGLFGWSNADWRAVCQALGQLKDAPNPAGVLEGMLGEKVEDAAPGLTFYPG